MSRMRKGFTLIELLIVVVIIGILAAIAIPKFASTKEKAYLASEKSDLRNLATSEEAYFSGNQTYSTNQSDLNFTTSQGVTITGWPLMRRVGRVDVAHCDQQEVLRGLWWSGRGDDPRRYHHLRPVILRQLLEALAA